MNMVLLAKDASNEFRDASRSHLSSMGNGDELVLLILIKAI
jgi:hypothetical protein